MSDNTSDNPNLPAQPSKRKTFVLKKRSDIEGGHNFRIRYADELNAAQYAAVEQAAELHDN